MFRLSLLLALAACGDNVLEDPFALRDGWRLQLHYWSYEDGSRQWDRSAFFDAALGTDCTLQGWSDGHTYCTPSAGVVSYLDAACTDPVGRVVGAVEPPGAFKREFVLDATRVPSRLYRRGDERPPPLQYWRFNNNLCEGPFEAPTDRYFDVTELDVARVRTTMPLGDGRIRLAMLTSDDGMRAPSTLHDTVTGGECVPAVMRDGSTHCLPTRSADAAVFRDDACTQRLLAVPGKEPLPPVARIDQADGCASYARIGAEVSKYPLFFRTGGECLPIELPDTELVYELADPVDPRLDLIPTGQARIQPLELGDGAMHFATTRALDTALDAACEVAYVHDVPRCLPRITGSIARYFTSEACQGPLQVTLVPRRACEAPVHFAGNPLPAVTIRELGERYTGPLFEGFGTCAPVVVLPEYEVRLVGAEVPLDTFVAARRE